MSLNSHVAHRCRLPVKDWQPDVALFAEVGRAEVAKFVDALYDRIETDKQLRPKFAGNTLLEQDHQKKFFEQWLGGEPLYAFHVGRRSLREIHAHIHISRQEAGRWLGHVEAALEPAGFDGSQRQQFLAVLKPLAAGLVNEAEDALKHQHRCFRTKPWKSLISAAEKGNLATVRAAVEAKPSLLKDIGPELLYGAARRGRTEVAAWLLEAEVDPNHPVSGELLLATPLCIARHKRKSAVVELLEKHGAVDDIFTQASLGNCEGMEQWLATDSSLLNTPDPGADLAGMPPVYYAVYCGHRDLAMRLLDSGAELGPLSTWLVRWAAERPDLELLQRLLDAGADTTRMGVGRWVLDDKLAKLLSAHGADVCYEPNPWASWIWKSCTGNNRQRDDPEYVQALIAHGVQVNAIHPYWGVAALHFAAKAGFVNTIQVLLDAGADPNLRDAKQGETPLFYVFKAGKSVDRGPVAALLRKAGADPKIANALGRTLVETHPKAESLL